jgi:hypothetical protein
MSQDLLTRIQRELCERLRELRSAVDEHVRLTAELQGLRALPEPVAAHESVAGTSSHVVLEQPVASRPPDLPDSLVVAEPLPANGTRSPAMCSLPRTRMVSPKVARLMCPQGRPALGYPGIPRTRASMDRDLGDDLTAGVDLFPGADPHLGLDEVDVEAERYERSL